MGHTDEWVVRTNLKNFKEKLLDERNPDRRRVLEELIAKEEAKLTQDD